MNIEFDCACSSTLSEFTRGGPSGDLRVQCDACGGVYAVTITQLQDGTT